jgi:mono/diheme cytochrome c family protein
MMANKTLKKIVIILIVAILLFGAIQLIPYGKNHTNPPVVAEPAWDSQQTRDLAKRACFDCHSNETIWPWYSNIAPVSWYVYYDVMEGRNSFNFSDWQNSQLNDLMEFESAILDGDMPPFQYILTHNNAKLSETENDQLINGLLKTFGQ